MNWKKSLTSLLQAVQVPLLGAGFRKPDVDISRHPNMITFDGHSVYFFNLDVKEASRLLDEATLLNGYNGWLAYLLHEVFYDDSLGDLLYEVLFDHLASGSLKRPSELTKESVYRWVDTIAPEVEKIKRDTQTKLQLE